MNSAINNHLVNLLLTLTFIAILTIGTSCQQERRINNYNDNYNDTVAVESVDTVVSDYRSESNYSTPPVSSQSIQPAPPEREIVNVRIQNSLMQTDKRAAFYLEIDEDNMIMTLEGTVSNDMIKLIREGAGTYTILLYTNGSLEASKTVYRREDLEHSNDEQVYTSRTGEIIITLFY